MRAIPKEQNKNYRKILMAIPLPLANELKAESVIRNMKYYDYLEQCLRAGHRVLSAKKSQIHDSKILAEN